MAAGKKRTNLVFRLSLLTACLLLLATQFNYRYYTIANFFVYGSNTVSTVGHITQVLPLHKAGSPVVYRIDKRFYSVDVVKVSALYYQPALFTTEIERAFGILRQVYSSSDLPVPSLRGPPLA